MNFLDFQSFLIKRVDDLRTAEYKLEQEKRNESDVSRSIILKYKLDDLQKTIAFNVEMLNKLRSIYGYQKVREESPCEEASGEESLRKEVKRILH